MLPFKIFIKYANVVYDLGYVEPEECSVVSIINDAKKVILRQHIEGYETWELSTTFPWNGFTNIMGSDDKLMSVFEEYDRQSKPSIEFEVKLKPIVVEHPEDQPGGLLLWSPSQPASATHPDIPTNGPPIPNVGGSDNEVDPSVTDSEEDEYMMPDESSDESEVSLIDENNEEETILGEETDLGKGHCDPDGCDRLGGDSSDEDNGLTRMARYCKEHQWFPNPDGLIELSDGQILGNAKAARDIIKRYAIQEGFTLKKIKNDSYRYTVKCKNDKCDWRIHSSCLPDGVTFMIKSVRGGHRFCPRVAANKEANARWVSSVLGSTIHSNPDISSKVLKNELRDKFALNCDRQVIYRAKKIVLKNLTTDHIDSYSKLRKYANAILHMNPGSCAKVRLDTGMGVNPKFERFYLSFNAMQTGFIKGCRPLIGVDGCHLTGRFGGVMLSAVALDGDSGIFPIAFCICESENGDSWKWFLGLLHDSLGWEHRRPICFMSDRQKGGLSALDDEWPNAGKRCCFRHMLANFKSAFKNHSMNGKLWGAARAGSVADFNDAMKSIGEDSPDAVTWLMEEDVNKWARHTFDERIKSDHVTNNMSECFNSWIKDERDKPILTLLEHLRRKIMVRFSDKWDEMEKLDDVITPYARQKLNANEKHARKLQVMHGRGEWYETLDRGGKKVLVNLGSGQCDCGMWQISGLPCMHVIPVFMYNRQNAHEHVHWYYSKEAMKLTYSGAINPIPDESRWPEYQNENIEPPLKRPKAGRPKKKRKRAVDEPRAPTKTFTNRCQICKTIGHNKRTCPLKVQDTAEPSTSKGKKASKRVSSKSRTETSQSNTVASVAASVNPLMQVAANAVPRFVPNVCSQIGSDSNP